MRLQCHHPGLVPVAGCTLRHHAQRSPCYGLMGRLWGRTTQAGVSLTHQTMISLPSLSSMAPRWHRDPTPGWLWRSNLAETALPPLSASACCLPCRAPMRKTACLSPYFMNGETPGFPMVCGRVRKGAQTREGSPVQMAPGSRRARPWGLGLASKLICVPLAFWALGSTLGLVGTRK